MKKITDLIPLIEKQNELSLEVRKDIKDYMAELNQMNITLNKASHYGIIYNIDCNPIIDIENDKIKDIKISLIATENNVGKTLFTCSTIESFYKFYGVNGYERDDSPIHGNSDFRQKEEVRFHDFYFDYGQKLFKEIVEDFIVTAFINNEKLIATQQNFKQLVQEQKSFSRKPL